MLAAGAVPHLFIAGWSITIHGNLANDQARILRAAAEDGTAQEA
jgi:hypothetical protein